MHGLICISCNIREAGIDRAIAAEAAPAKTRQGDRIYILSPGGLLEAWLRSVMQSSWAWADSWVAVPVAGSHWKWRSTQA
jgi:hypothetical protein